MSQYIVYTYGSGEVLESLFQAIATVVGGKDKGTLFNYFMRLGFSLGLVGVLFLSLQGHVMKHLAHWFVPLYVMLALLFTPLTSLWVKDLASGYVAKIDHVPWGLGAFAGTISGLSQALTEALEKVFSLPDDLKYHKSGAMMASKLIAQARTFHITTIAVSETLKEFVTQCVVYDALLGRKYTLDELRTSPDIWGLVKATASPARAFTFRPPGAQAQSKIMTCKEGVGALEKLLSLEIETAFTYFGAKIFPPTSHNQPPSASHRTPGATLKAYMNTAFEFMTGLQDMVGGAEAIMRQQMMIYGVIDGIDSKSAALGNASHFALRRAYLQGRTQQETAAGLAEKTMIALKNVMEALIYASFIFILPLMCLPRGWRFVGNWCSLVVWIQMWPPLYALINFLMNLMAQSRGIISLKQADGLTLANAIGFADLHADMAACAGYMSLSVGTLAYALVKGGVTGLSSMAGTFSSPLLTSSSRSVEDMLSGNYSFGNVSLGTVQARNESWGQQMLSPSYSSGFFSHNDGSITRVTTAEGRSYVTVANSHLRSNLNWGETLSASFSHQAQEALTASQSQAKAYANTRMEGYRQALELASHQSQSQSWGEGSSMTHHTQEQEAYTHLDSLVETFARDHRISKDVAVQKLARAAAGVDTKRSLGGKVMGMAFGFSGHGEVSFQGAFNKSTTTGEGQALSFAQQASFQKALQETLTHGREGRFHRQDETSKRFQDSMNTSFDKSAQHRREHQAQLQKAASYTKAATYAQQQSASFNASLNQDFVEWLAHQFLPQSQGAMGRRAAETLLAGRADSLIPYQKKFLDTYGAALQEKMELTTREAPAAIKVSYEASHASIPSSQGEFLKEKNDLSHQWQARGGGPDFQMALEAREKEWDTYIDHKEAAIPEAIKAQTLQHQERAQAETRLGGAKETSRGTLQEDSPTVSSSQTPQAFTERSEVLKEETEKFQEPDSSFPALEGDRPSSQETLKRLIRTEIEQALEELEEAQDSNPLPPFSSIKKD